MFCPDIKESCHQDCVFWSEELGDCLKKLGFLKELDILSRESKQKITEIKRKNIYK